MSRDPLDELVAAERNAPPRPSDDAAKSTWRRVQRSVAVGAVPAFDLPPSAVAPASGTAWLGGAAKLLLATAVGVGGTVAAVRATSNEPLPPDPVSREAAVSPRVEPPRVPEPAPDVAPIQAPAEPAALDVHVVPGPEGRDVPARTRARAARVPTPEKSPAPSGIGREVELVKQAGRAVNRGDHREAQSLLDTHAREFPSGALTEDREALRAIARCSDGTPAKKRSVAAGFVDRFPRSVHAERVLDACASPLE